MKPFDPESWLEWKVIGQVDFDESREQGRAVVELTQIVRQ